MSGKKEQLNKVFDFTSESYLNNLTWPRLSSLYKRIEPRTRSINPQKALSMQVFDPFWMLTRQWQFGRFKAVDCGTPVLVKVKTTRQKIDGIGRKIGKDKFKDEVFSTDVPLEYDVEKQNIELTPYVRVESAMYLKKLIASQAKAKELNDIFLEEYPLDKIENEDLIEVLKNDKNEALVNFMSFYQRRSFDGYKVYCAIKTGMINDMLAKRKVSCERVKPYFVKYAEWFANKFEPASIGDCWNISKIGYESRINQGNNVYVAEDYDSGNLSWYSYDAKNAPEPDSSASSTVKAEDVKMLSYIPTPAKFPGAPSSRLWEMENRKVNMGNNDNDFGFVGTAAIMQYVTMYSNDWMITPLETETGTVLNVEGIVVKDSFGDRIYIDKNAQQMDNVKPEDAFTDTWNMFGSSYEDAYAKDNFSTHTGMLFPPTVLRCEESKPLEEVQFLRDEMANMVWGVETTLNNGCGGTMDGRTLSDKVFEQIDTENLDAAKQAREAAAAEDAKNGASAAKTAGSKAASLDEAEYSLLIQNRVPLNWIPFVPEQIKGDCRNIALRRGRMPIYYEGKYQSVRPSTDLIGVKKDSNDKTVPLYINEEEITGCGVKVVKTAQRTRWFLGKSFNWVGNKQVISEYQANSGLMFDDLIKKSDGKQIKLEAKNPNK